MAAVLAVRQSGIFTAVIQPPLILFCAVPGAYFLFHGAKFTGIKDLLINCGYPLIERFPLMLFTSAGVLLIGHGPLVPGQVQSQAAETTDTAAADAAGDGGRVGLVARLTAMFNREGAEDEPAEKADQAPAAPNARRRALRESYRGRQQTDRPASSVVAYAAPTPPAGRRTRPDPASTPDTGVRWSRAASSRAGRRAIRTCGAARRGRSAATHTLAEAARPPQRPLRPVRAHGTLRRPPHARTAPQTRTQRDHRDAPPDLAGQVSEGCRRRASRTTNARGDRASLGRVLGLRRLALRRPA